MRHLVEVVENNVHLDSDRPNDADLASAEAFIRYFNQEVQLELPVRVSIFEKDVAVRQALSGDLTISEANLFLPRIRIEGRLVEPIHAWDQDQPLRTGTPPAQYDQDRVDAIAALAWSRRQLLTEGQFMSPGRLDLQKIGAYAKNALGNKPIASFIRLRGEEGKENSTPGVTGHSKRDDDADRAFFDSVRPKSLEGIETPQQIYDDISDRVLSATLRSIEEQVLIRIKDWPVNSLTLPLHELSDITDLPSGKIHEIICELAERGFMLLKADGQRKNTYMLTREQTLVATAFCIIYEARQAYGENLNDYAGMVAETRTKLGKSILASELLQPIEP